MKKNYQQVFFRDKVFDKFAKKVLDPILYEYFFFHAVEIFPLCRCLNPLTMAVTTCTVREVKFLHYNLDM